MIQKLILISFYIGIMLGCKTEHKKKFDERQYIKDLKIERIETIRYPSKFGKISYEDGFITEISTLDSNGYVINAKHFNQDEYMKKYNSEEKHSYSNNYNNCRIEKYNFENNLDEIYIDTSINEQLIERRIYNKNQILTSLIKYKYDDDKLIELIVYDSIGEIESKDINTFSNNKQIKSISYDKFNHISNRKSIEYDGNITTTKSYDKDNKLDYQSQSTRQGDLMISSKGIYIYEKDTTHYRTDYTYQDSIFYKKNTFYKNEELEYVEEFKLIKRK